MNSVRERQLSFWSIHKPAWLDILMIYNAHDYFDDCAIMFFIDCGKLSYANLFFYFFPDSNCLKKMETYLPATIVFAIVCLKI